MKINRKIMYFFQNQICNFAMLVLYIITIFTLEIMKKLMFMALAALALASCSENSTTQDEVTDNTTQGECG